MATKSSEIDDSYPVIAGDINSPNPHMEEILEDLFGGDAKQIVQRLERVRWMTQDQAYQFALYFKPAPKTGVNHYVETISHFVFVKPSKGKGRRKSRAAQNTSFKRGLHMYQTFLKLFKDHGFKPKLSNVLEFALINWDEERLEKKVSGRTLGSDFRNYIKDQGIKLPKHL